MQICKATKDLFITTSTLYEWMRYGAIHSEYAPCRWTDVHFSATFTFLVCFGAANSNY